MIISENITNKNNSILRSDAVFTRLSRSKNKITQIIKPEVNSIENVGVPRFDTFAKE
jgi:hypothetical protein